jgi:hypothetical protein
MPYKVSRLTLYGRSGHLTLSQKALQHLQKNMPCLTVVDIKMIANGNQLLNHLPPYLEALCIDASVEITRNGWTYLQRLHNLKVFTGENFHAGTYKEIFKNICQSIISLTLKHSVLPERLDEADLKRLQQLHNLKSLYIWIQNHPSELVDYLPEGLTALTLWSGVGPLDQQQASDFKRRCRARCPGIQSMKINGVDL